MATISSIVVELKGKTAQLVEPMKKAVAAVKSLNSPVVKAMQAAKSLGSAMSNAAIKSAKALAKIGKSLKRVGGQLLNTVKRAGKLAVAFKALTFAAGAGLFAKMTGDIIDTANALDKVIKTANNLGVAVSSLQKLQFQAGQSGIASADLTTALRQLQRVTGEAGNGNKKAAQTFQQLGVSLESIKNLSIIEIFNQVGGSIKSLSSDTERAAVSNTLFGRNWLSILNLIRSDLDKTGAAFDKLGTGITASQGRAIEAFNDARDRLSQLWDSFYIQLTAKTAKAFTAMIQWIERTIASYGGMEGAAKAAADFMIDGLVGVVNAAEGAVNAVQALSSSFAEISSGNFGRRLALLTVSLEKFAVSKFITPNTAQSLKELTKAQELLASDIVSTERNIENGAKKTAAAFDKIRSSITKAREAIKKTNEETKTPEVAKKARENKTELVSLDSIKEAEKLSNKKQKEEKKRNSEAEKYSRKIKMQNEQLREQAKIMETLAAKLKEVQGSTTFAGGLTALSDVLSKANDDSLSTKERNAQRALFEQSKVRFAGTDFSGTTTKIEGKIDISVKMNSEGIIEPVVESTKFNNEVSNIVVNTIRKQSRLNDR